MTKLDETLEKIQNTQEQYNDAKEKHRTKYEEKAREMAKDKEKEFTNIHQDYINSLKQNIDKMIELISKVNVEEMTKEEAENLFGPKGKIKRLFESDNIKDKINFYAYQSAYNNLMNKFRSQELDGPWDKCSPELYYDKLKMELNHEHSVAIKIGDPYKKIVEHIDRLNNKWNELIEEENKVYESGEYIFAYSNDQLRHKLLTQASICKEIRDEVIEFTVNLLFKKTITVDVYIAKSKELEVHAQPIIQAIGLAMSGLAITALVLGLLFPVIPVGLLIGASIGTGLAGYGFFYASRPDNFSKEVKEGLTTSMEDLARAATNPVY